MDKNTMIRLEDLINNPTPRVPVCLCLDTSGSMCGAPINELNDGVKLFYDAVGQDETARYAAEISIVTFGGVSPQCVMDFASLQLQSTAPILSADGMTPMGEAVNMALDMMERRKQEYKSRGVDYFQPWLVLMSDGSPNGKLSELSRAEQRCMTLMQRKKLTVFPIGIGDDADMDALSHFSTWQPLKLQGLKFREFFAWLSKSVSTTSQSMPGDDIKLDTDGIKGWREL